MRRNKSKTWLIIAILTLLVGLAWIGVAANVAFRKSTVSKEVIQAVTPLDPTLDATIFTKLARRNGNK